MSDNIVRPLLLLVCSLAIFLSGCSGHYAYQQGLEFDDEGRYEESVASYFEAVQENPDKLEYKVRLQKAREYLDVALRTWSRADADYPPAVEARRMVEALAPTQ